MKTESCSLSVCYVNYTAHAIHLYTIMIKLELPCSVSAKFQRNIYNVHLYLTLKFPMDTHVFIIESINKQNFQHLICIMRRFCHLEVVKYLIEIHGCSLEYTDNIGKTPLHEVCE